MRINANIMAVNTQRQLFGAQTSGAKSMEKLSSGFRINRAADDAAGLAISEKMRSQIRGMRQASTNAQDAISVVQTAEGALDEVHSMLQRMKELSVQSANDSNQQYVDRESIQKEIDALTTEIDSITVKTQFNKMRLLDGSFIKKQFHVGANKDETIGVSIESMTAKGIGLNVGGAQMISTVVGAAKTENGNGTSNLGYAASSVIDLTNFLTTSGTSASEFKLTINGKSMNIATAATGGATETATLVAAKINEVLGPGSVEVATNNVKFSKDVIAEIELEVVTKGAGVAAAMTPGSKPVIAQSMINTKAEVTFAYTPSVVAQDITLRANGKEFTVNIKGGASDAEVLSEFQKFQDLGNFDATAGSPTSKIEIKSRAKGSDQQISITTPAKEARKQVDFVGINVLTREKANEAIENVQTAIETLASRRASLGAIQNRVEHTIKNLDNSHENLMAAESRIRHVDMAKEIIENTRQNILQQAATSMLAQANQAPQTVLQLLR